MHSRERFRNALAHQEGDRIPIANGFPWPEAVARWRKEGLPEDTSIDELLDLDATSGVWLTGNLGYPTEVIEETDEYKIEVTASGVTTKQWKDHYATPLQIDFAIKTAEDWERWKGNLTQERFPVEANVIEDSQKARQSGRFHYLTIDEPIWFALRLLGHDHCLERMIEAPAFVEDIVATITHFGLARAEGVIEAGGQFDALWLWSDLCYKNGMLF